MTAEHGGGMPHTRRGLAMAYGPVPWQMITRTLAVWYRLADPAEAQRHSHPSLRVEPDPVVRARFWDIRHDGGRAGTGDYIELREAAIGFPVHFAGEQGDDTVYMFATDPVYTAFGREMMGWPVVGGDVSVDPASLNGRNVLASWITPQAPEGQYWAEPRAGDRFSGTLTRRGHALMHMTVELSAPVEPEQAQQRPGPRWITHRFLPDVTGASTVDQIIQTAPTRVAWGSVWRATGQLEFPAAPGSELHYLAPREIVAAEYWCNLRLELGSGRILAGAHQ
jgi:Acetoacetate decarboxylase (ADC)